MKKPDKVYLVFGDAGEYDDYHSWVEAVYHDKEKAEKLVEDNNKALQEHMALCIPWNDKYRELDNIVSKETRPIINQLRDMCRNYTILTGKTANWREINTVTTGEAKIKATELLTKFDTIKKALDDHRLLTPPHCIVKGDHYWMEVFFVK